MMKHLGTIAWILLVALGLVFGVVVAQESRTPAEQERAEPREGAEAVREGASAHETPPPFSIKAEGTKTWALRYGLGHPAILASLGAQHSILTMDQSLVVDVTGEAFSILRAEARYNDQASEIVESMALRLDTDRLSGVLGDFAFTTVPGFTTYMKTMRGLQLVYRMGDSTLTAVASRAQGIPESLVFVGESVQTHVEYRFAIEDREITRPAPYSTTLEGMDSYRLENLYTDEFSSVCLRFSIQQGLKGELAAYEMAVLSEAMETEPEWELKPADFRVLLSVSEEQALLLSRDPSLLLRSRIRDLIALHNEMNGLSGDEAMVYPFVEGTDYERGFLDSLSAYALLVVDQAEYRVVEQSERRRFYNLGRINVEPSTAVVEVSKEGRTFETVTDVSMPDYLVTIHEEEGIAECDFPDDFYTPSSVMRITFSYQTLEGAFMLGLSLIPGSERVLLNSARLKEGTDYAIDYETGVLFLLVDLKETDVLQIDYERYAGGFGTTSPYARGFYGLSLDVPVSPTLDVQMNLMQMADVARATASLEGIATMPNRHTVVGMQADFTVDDLLATVRIGYNYDVFPFDSNDRIPVENAVYAIASGGDYVFFGHRAGISVFDGDVWRTYGMESGLSGRMVQAVTVHEGVVYMGTNAGLTTVRLDGASPFDRVTNWSRLFTKNQIPSASITALLVHNDDLWMGTGDGLVQMSLSESPSWERLTGPEPDGLPKITALCAVGDTIFVGTAQGAYAYDLKTGEFRRVVGTEDDIIYDFAVEDSMLYVASGQGLSVFRREEFISRLLLGNPVYAVETANGELYYGTEDGVLSMGASPAPMPRGHAVTAMAVAPEGVWVGCRAADKDGTTVWLIAQDLETYPGSITGIPDRDVRAFKDTPAADHTATGWMSTASFRQDTDRYSMTGSIELLQPAFRAIGSTQRADSAAWKGAGEFSLWNWGDLSIRHEYRMTGHQDTTPSSRMTNSMSLKGDGSTGLQWTTSLTVVDARATIAGLVVPNQEVSAGASIHETFFGEALRVEARWDLFDVRAEQTGSSWQRESYGISYDGTLSSSLSTTGSWDRRLQRTEDRLSGTDRAEWRWTWKPALTIGEITWAKATAQYETRIDRALSAQAASWLHEGSLGLTFADFVLGEWRVGPSLRTEAILEESRTDLRAETASSFAQDQMTFRASLIASLTDLGQPVYHRDLVWSANWRYTGIKTLDLSATYSGDLCVAVMGAARSPTSTNTVTGRLVWTSTDGLRDDLSATLRLREDDGEQQLTGSIKNDLTVDVTTRVTTWLGRDLLMQLEGMPKAHLRFNSSAEYRSRGGEPHLTISQTVDLFLSWPPNGSISAGVTYSGEWKEATGLRTGILLQGSVAVDF
jgi:hypothetical protein